MLFNQKNPTWIITQFFLFISHFFGLLHFSVLGSPGSPGQVLLNTFELIDFIFLNKLGGMAQVCSVIVPLEFKNFMPRDMIYPCAYSSIWGFFWASLDFSNDPNNWCLEVFPIQAVPEIFMGWSVDVYFVQNSFLHTEGWQTEEVASTSDQWIVYFFTPTS